MNSTPVIILRSLVFNLLFISWALFTSIIFLPLFITSEKVVLRAGAPWAKGALWLARVVCGITYEVRGREYIARQPVIYASKHQSAWDTAIFLILLHQPAYVLKRELLRLPGWGWYLWRMKMIAIDRSGKASSLKQMVKDGKDALAKNRSIIIYPEGTRTKPGAAPHYHPGVIALYSQLKVPVVPVALNSGSFWGKNAFLKRPGKITIQFLPAIEAGLPKAEFSARMEGAIESTSQALLAEAQQQLSHT